MMTLPATATAAGEIAGPHGGVAATARRTTWVRSHTGNTAAAPAVLFAAT